MMSRQRCWCLAALGFLVAACGDAPPAPTPIVSPNPPTGTNTSGQTNALEALPASSGPLQDPDALAASSTPSVDAGAGPAPAVSVATNSAASVDAGAGGSSGGGSSAGGSAALGGEFNACSAPRITGCDDLFITFRQPSADLCVQLSLDNCGVFRGALTIDVPVSWRLSSATLGSAAACDLGAYDPKSVSAVSATGSITGVDDGNSLSQVEINLTLQLPPTAPNAAPVSVKTDKPIAASPRCDGT